jgi:hypothetical protein
MFRTRDAGRTWQDAVQGLPPSDGGFVRVVREDPARRGLLYAGTENGVFVSFDDGDRWQSLQLNLPVASVRDIVVHEQDVVICTYGRAMWILDDVSPLRQFDARVADADAFLFAPYRAIRVRRNDNNDTPIPPDLPSAPNPPTGAVLDYYLKTAASGPLTMGIYDARGRLVRTLSSEAEPAVEEEEPPNVPSYWFATPRPLATTAGMHRAVWDMRFPAPLAVNRDFPISATAGATPLGPEGPLAAPGQYEVRLTVNGRTLREPLTLVADPRVHVSQGDFDRQAAFELGVSDAMRVSFDARRDALALRAAIADRLKDLQARGATASTIDAVRGLDRRAASLVAAGGGRGGGTPGGATRTPTLTSVNANLGALLEASDLADGAPTEGMRTAWTDYCRDLGTLAARMNELRGAALTAVNDQLARAGAARLDAPPAMTAPPCGTTPR